MLMVQKGVKVYTINIANVEYITVDETHSFLYATTPEYIPIKNIWDTANMRRVYNFTKCK